MGRKRVHEKGTEGGGANRGGVRDRADAHSSYQAGCTSHNRHGKNAAGITRQGAVSRPTFPSRFVRVKTTELLVAAEQTASSRP